MARANGTSRRVARHRVYTLAQAAAIVGVDERSVSDRAKRRARNGRPVAWTRGEPGNPMPCVLVDAAWVLDVYAAEHDGVKARIEPAVVPLPVLENGPAPESTDLVGTGQPSAEEAFRTRDLESLLEVAAQANVAKDQLRLEQENERLRVELARLHAAASALLGTQALGVEAAPRPATPS